MKIPPFLERYFTKFSYWGLVVATLFFAASLTPSLLPRNFLFQGLLSGFALAIGYGVGVFAVWLYRYLELPVPGPQLERLSKKLTAIGTGLVAVSFLWRDTVWQNSIRELMEMEPVDTSYPWRIGAIALVTAAVLITLTRTLVAAWQVVDRQINRFVPRRISYAFSTLAIVLLVLFVSNRVVARLALNAADAIFLQLDKYDDEDIQQPANPLASGSRDSLIAWDSIGIRGKNFIAQGPTQEQIAEFTAAPALRPLRIYAGLRSTETTAERAQLALDELKRVGGFDRAVLVIATTTGTGWLDPGAVDTLEYLHHGNTAIVAMQYSYLPSWITILVDPLRSRDTARALFDKVYYYWTTLPRDKRPMLYVHGLSLGSLGSEASVDLFTVFSDPIQGAVWSGPPFPSRVWADLTSDRNPDSPSWLPTFRDGSMVRFTARENFLNAWGTRWSPMRFVYIQHASDPMIFFEPTMFFRKPEWLVGKRGPDVSPYFRWLPIVTFLQTAFDLPMATSVPHGYGHNYAASSYIDAWLAVTDPPDWKPADTSRLKEHFAE